MSKGWNAEVAPVGVIFQAWSPTRLNTDLYLPVSYEETQVITNALKHHWAGLINGLVSFLTELATQDLFNFTLE